MTTTPEKSLPPLSPNGLKLIEKWDTFNLYGHRPGTPLDERRHPVIKREQIPFFLEDLRALRIGVIRFQHWVIIDTDHLGNKISPSYNISELWDTPNIGKGEPGWVDYSIDYVIAYLQPEHPKPIDSVGREGMPGYREIHDVEALEFFLDLFGDYPDTPGPVQKESFDDEDWPCVYEKYPDLFNQQ